MSKRKLCVLAVVILVAAAGAHAAIVTVDENIHYQTIDGFGAFGLRNVNWAAPSSWWTDAWGNMVIGDLGLTIHRNEYYPPEPPYDQDTQFADQAPYFQLLRNKANQLGEPLKIIITYWTPPAWMKDNNSTKNGGHVLPEYYDDLGTYSVNALNQFAGIGVPVYALSLQNELLFAEPYNSCVYTAAEYRDMLKIAGPIIHGAYPNVRLYGDEHMLWGITRDWDWANTSPINKVISDPAADAQMNVWAVHGYSDGVNPDPASQADWVKARQRLNIDNTQKHFWMTETSGFADDWNGSFSLATQIFSGLKYGHLSAWVWWQLSEPGGGSYALMDTDTPTKRYYVSKQFYRYIRPDAVMVECSTDIAGVYAAAFTHSANQTLTIVILNTSGSQQTTNLSVSGSLVPAQFTVYRTTASENCINAGTVSINGSVNLPTSSITTLYGIRSEVPPDAPLNPNPAHNATGVSILADLSWTAGPGSTSHDVHFGTVTPPPFITNQPASSFDPGQMLPETIYYWQIQERNDYGVTPGPVWSFTTEAPQLPAPATNPSPADAATAVSRTADLSWTAGAGATSHDIYFGTDPNPGAGQFRANQPGTTFDLGAIGPNTAYYWRIDEVNPFGTTTGVVWSFTTTDVLPIAFDGASSAHDNDAGGSTLTFQHTIGKGLDRILVVGVGAEADNPANIPVTSVTYNGVPMTLVPNSTVITGSTWYLQTVLYYMLNANLPPAGTYNVSVTFAGSILDRCAGAVSLFYVRPGPPENAVTNLAADPGATAISTQIATYTNGDWLVDVVGSGDPGSFTTTAAGMVERWDTAAESSDAAGSTKYVAAAGTATMSWQHNTQKRLTHSVAAFAPSGGICPFGDLDGDCKVDHFDVLVLCEQWLDSGDCSASPDCADLNDSNHIDFSDLAILGEKWGM